MQNDFNIVVLISGRGSNLEALQANCHKYRISAVLSDKPNAPGLNFAQQHGIAHSAFGAADFESKQAALTALYARLDELSPDLAVLAGFMRIIPEEVVNRWQGRMINIHPSLLSAYPGLNTHARVLEAGDTQHGCSVHFVDSGVDSGPLIAQAEVKCFPESDNPDTLAARVLEREHDIYPFVVNAIADGMIRYEGGQVFFKSDLETDAGARNFVLKGNRV